MDNGACPTGTGLPMNGAGQAVSAVPVGIPSAAHSDAVTVFVGAARLLWRSVMVENNCISSRCVDIGGENCICLPDFVALASCAMNVPEMVLRDDAQGIETRRAETLGSVHESPVAEGDAPITQGITQDHREKEA